MLRLVTKLRCQNAMKNLKPTGKVFHSIETLPFGLYMHHKDKFVIKAPELKGRLLVDDFSELTQKDIADISLFEEEYPVEYYQIAL